MRKGGKGLSALIGSVHGKQHAVIWVIPGDTDNQDFTKTITGIPRLDREPWNRGSDLCALHLLLSRSRRGENKALLCLV